MNALINQLVRDASAKDQAENELRDLRERTETFNVEVPDDPDHRKIIGDELFERIRRQEALRRIATMLFHHPRSIRIADAENDGRRYTVRVILEPEK